MLSDLPATLREVRVAERRRAHDPGDVRRGSPKPFDTLAQLAVAETERQTWSERLQGSHRSARTEQRPGQGAFRVALQAERQLAEQERGLQSPTNGQHHSYSGVDTSGPGLKPSGVVTGADATQTYTFAFLIVDESLATAVCTTPAE